MAPLWAVAHPGPVLRSWEHDKTVVLRLHFPLLVPHTQKEPRQQRKQIAEEEPKCDHQARRAGTEIQRKGSSQVGSWRVCFWWTLLTEVPAGRAQQVSIVNPAVHLNSDWEHLPGPATQIGSVLNPNL